MIYVLLIIIAIGVLLISESGKKLLSLFVALLIISGLGFLLTAITGGGIALLSDKNTRDTVFTVLGFILLISYGIYWIYSMYKKHERGGLTKQVLEDKVKNLWLENWKKHKGWIIFLIISFCFIIVNIIYTVTI